MKDCLSLIRAFFLSVSIKPSRVVVYQQKNDRQCKALFKVYYFLFAIVSVILCFAPATSSYSALKFSPQFGVVDVMARFTYVRFLFFFFHFIHLSLQSRPQCLHNMPPPVIGHAQKSSGIEIAFIGFLCCRLVLKFLA